MTEALVDEELDKAAAVLDGLADTMRWKYEVEVVLTQPQIDYLAEKTKSAYNAHSTSTKTDSVEFVGLAEKFHCRLPVVIVRRMAKPVAPGFKGTALGDVNYCSICGASV